jgi:23S rRNA (pseudouridine1915-N3)-methyltransferase
VRIAVIAVGKVKQAGLRTEIDEYLARIRRYARCEEIELKDGPDNEVAARFRKVLGERTKSVALEVNGVHWGSERLAAFLAQCENNDVGTLALLIGGAYGLPKQISQTADLRLSLSSMTLPHRIARLLLVEQIYRGFTILRKEPYAH